LGCGARSYTSTLHYASDYAVSAPNVKAILADYIKQPDEVFDAAQHGFRLNADEQRRRYLLQSLLQVEGVEFGAYRARFGTDVLQDFPMLGQLVQNELANVTPEGLRLTPAGLEKSDAIGPWLHSPTVHARMEAYELK
jgi:oxygen-independent coproporphyrinogen III oxidase